MTIVVNALFQVIRVQESINEFHIIIVTDVMKNMNPSIYAISTEICFALIVWLRDLEKLVKGVIS